LPSAGKACTCAEVRRVAARNRDGGARGGRGPARVRRQLDRARPRQGVATVLDMSAAVATEAAPAPSAVQAAAGAPALAPVRRRTRRQLRAVAAARPAARRLQVTPHAPAAAHRRWPPQGPDEPCVRCPAPVAQRAQTRAALQGAPHMLMRIRCACSRQAAGTRQPQHCNGGADCRPARPAAQAGCGLQMGAQTLRFAACQDLSANVSTGYTLMYTLIDNGNGTCTLSGAVERPAAAPGWVAFGLAKCDGCGMDKGSALIARTDAASPTGARPADRRAGRRWLWKAASVPGSHAHRPAGFFTTAVLPSRCHCIRPTRHGSRPPLTCARGRATADRT